MYVLYLQVIIPPSCHSSVIWQLYYKLFKVKSYSSKCVHWSFLPNVLSQFCGKFSDNILIPPLPMYSLLLIGLVNFVIDFFPLDFTNWMVILAVSEHGRCHVCRVAKPSLAISRRPKGTGTWRGSYQQWYDVTSREIQQQCHMSMAIARDAMILP